MLTKSKILAFLEKRAAIKVTIFLNECGLGRNYLTQKDTEKIPNDTAMKIELIMKKYGYKPE